MISIHDLENMKVSRAMTYALSALTLVVPGAIYLYFYYREMFFTLPTLKLLLLALIISSPLFIINIFVSAVMVSDMADFIRRISEYDDELLRKILKDSYDGMKIEISKYKEKRARETVSSGSEDEICGQLVGTCMVTLAVLVIPLLFRILFQIPSNFRNAIVFIIILQVGMIIIAYNVAIPSESAMRKFIEKQNKGASLIS